MPASRSKKAFGAPGGPATLCSKAVAGRYPFNAGASNDIPLDDFARLFAPGGLLDKFFNDNLQSFVDTSGAAWKAQPVAGVTAPVSPGDLAQFQRASQIRDLFFAAGGNQPTVRFDITPLETDAKQVTLDLDGQAIVYAHGPQRPVSVTWPGQNRMNSVRLVFDPPPTERGAGVPRDRTMGTVPPVRPGHAAAERGGGSLYARLPAGRPPCLV